MPVDRFDYRKCHVTFQESINGILIFFATFRSGKGFILVTKMIADCSRIWYNLGDSSSLKTIRFGEVQNGISIEDFSQR